MTERVVAGGMEPGEIRRRALAGTAVLGGRAVVMRTINLFGTVALARLLGPSDLGVIALGLALLFAGHFLVDAGLGSALIRRSDPPDHRDLRSLVAFQLAVGAAAALVVLGLAPLLGEPGWVGAAMLAALPLTAFRTPGDVLLQRQLAYRLIATVEIVEVVVFQACAVALVLAGLGVWGVAIAGAAKIVCGTALMVVRGPAGLVAPIACWRRLRPLLAFAGRFQAVGLVATARDHGLSLGIAGLAGTTVLGLWALTNRLLQVPLLIFTTLGQVAFPALSQLVAAGESPRREVERLASLAAVLTGLTLVPLVAAAPALVPAVFGAQWMEVPAVLAASCAGLLIAGPVSVAATGFLFAIDRAGDVLRSVVAGTVVWLLAAFTLLPLLGVVAVGVGHLVSCLVEAGILWRAAARARTAGTARAVLACTAPAILSASLGWAVASRGSADLATAAGAAALAELAFVAILLAVRRRPLLDTVRLAGRAVGQAGLRPA